MGMATMMLVGIPTVEYRQQYDQDDYGCPVCECEFVGVSAGSEVHMRPPHLSQRHILRPCHCDVCQSWLECMIILYFACTVMRGGTVLYSPRDSYMRRKLLTSDSYMTQLGLR